MANKVQIRRGLRGNLPALSLGEFGLCTDTNELFIGSAAGNVKVATEAQIAALNAQKVEGKWRIYNSLEELGLSETTVTISQIFDVMQNNSSLYCIVGSGGSAFPVPSGFLTIEKSRNNRNSIRYTQAGDTVQIINNQWIGNYYDGNFSGWRQVITQNSLKHSTQADLVIYLDSINGNDTTGDGSNSKPYKTWDKVYTLLDNLTISVGIIIRFKAGTYDIKDGYKNLYGFHYGILLESATRVASAVTLRILGSVGFNITENISRTSFTYMTIDCSLMTGTTTAIYSNFSRLYVNAVNMIGNSAKSITAIQGQRSTIDVGAVSFVNFSTCLCCATASIATIASSTGSGNGNYCVADSGIIQRYGTVPTVTTLEQKYNGGQIFN